MNNTIKVWKEELDTNNMTMIQNCNMNLLDVIVKIKTL